MGKKLVKAMSFLNIILAIVLYFSINNSFANDALIAELLERTGIVSTLIRLTIYVIPGVHLIAGLFGLVFSAKSILRFIGTFALVFSIITLIFLKGETEFMFILGIISVCISVIYMVGALIIKRPTVDTDNN